MKVLIVEDDPMLALMAAEVVSEAGYEVLGPAHSLAEARALMAAERPDFAIVDINLAGHDEGITVARELRDRCGTGSLFVSGQVAAALANPDAARGLLRKPYLFTDLLGSIAFLLSSSPADGVRKPAALELFPGVPR